MSALAVPELASLRKASSKLHKRVTLPSKCVDCPGSRPYCCPAGEMIMSRPRSSTPTMHDQMMRDRHRLRSAEEANRHGGNLVAGKSSPCRLPAVKRQHEGRVHDGRCQRSQSSDHHRPISKAVYFVLSCLFTFVSEYSSALSMNLISTRISAVAVIADRSAYDVRYSCLQTVL